MIDLLSEDEQRVLIELLIYTAKADGRIEVFEEEVLDQYAEILDIDFDQITGNEKPEDLIPQLDGPESRVIVLQEMLRIAHLDGEYDDREQSSVLDIAAMMHIPIDLLKELEEWVIDGLRWAWRGEELLDKANRVVKE